MKNLPNTSQSPTTGQGDRDQMQKAEPAAGCATADRPATAQGRHETAGLPWLRVKNVPFSALQAMAKQVPGGTEA